MKVKCVYNTASSLPENILPTRSGYNRLTKFPLIIGKEYIVYATTIYMGFVWYYICDEYYTYYPTGNPSLLFDVVDGRLSKSWIYFSLKDKDPYSTYAIFTYPEWANDPYYYDSLTDGDDNAVKIFKSYQELMDLEFPDDSISKNNTATLVKDNWLICPFCFNSWESFSTSGMLICSLCKKVLHNPLFSK